MTPFLHATRRLHLPGARRAVGPFSLAVQCGELHHVRGPSGSGKSTLARMLAD